MVRPGRRHRTLGPRTVAVAVGLGLALSATGAASQEALIGMSDVDQPGGPDELVRIDRTTGVATRLHVFGTGFNLLESVAYDARDNVLWTTNDNVLVRVQLGTYAVQVIDALTIQDVDGLAVQPSTGRLYGITYAGNDLVRIDKQDGAVLVLNGSLEVGSRLEDLAFDSTGRLYVLTSRALVEVDPATGVRISRVYLLGATSLEGLVWDVHRGAFLSAADRGDFKDLVAINRSTGQVTFLSDTEHSGFRDIEALAFVPGGSVVPVAMLALDASRDELAARITWQTHDDGIEFVVHRALEPPGPWLEIARVRQPVSGRPGRWMYEHQDLEAGSGELAGADLFYRVGAADADGVWSWLDFEVAAVPRGVVLRPNAPNPFNPTTAFEVQLASPGRIDLAIYDVSGRLVRAVLAERGAGTHALLWDGRDASGRAVAGGVYPYVLRAGGRTLRGQAVLVK
jgi:hypothetical protein